MGDRRLLVGDIGDVAEPQAPLVDHELTDLVHAAQRAHGSRRVASAVFADATEGDAAIDASQPRDERPHIDPMGLDLVDAEIDEDLARLDAVQGHTRDARNAAQAVQHPALEQLVVRREVHPRRGDAALDHGDVAGVERVDLDVPNLVG